MEQVIDARLNTSKNTCSAKQKPFLSRDRKGVALSPAANLVTSDLEKTLLRKVGEAIHRFKMIRDGDRIAVAVSGGKDSVTMLDALVLMQKRAPSISPSAPSPSNRENSCAPSNPSANTSAASASTGLITPTTPPSAPHRTARPRLRPLQPLPRRAVYEIARGLRCNVIAFRHTADDLCESLFRNIMFTGRLSSLPPVTYSREKDFRLIRPLVYVSEEITRAWVESKGVPVVPCGCSLRTGTVRRSIAKPSPIGKPSIRTSAKTSSPPWATSSMAPARYRYLDEAEQLNPNSSPYSTTFKWPYS